MIDWNNTDHDTLRIYFDKWVHKYGFRDELGHPINTCADLWGMMREVASEAYHAGWVDGETSVPEPIFDGPGRRALPTSELLMFERILRDVRRAERERCIAACHAVMHDDKLDRSSFEMGVAAVKMAIEALGDMVDMWGSGGGRKRVREFARWLKKYWHMRRDHQLISSAIREAYAAGVQAGREEAAVVCEEYELPEWDRTSDEAGRTCRRAQRESDPSLVALDCAVAIRNLPTVTP